MFLGAKEFKGVGLDKWQLSSMTRVDQMFDGATNFNKNLCAWGEQASFSYNRVDDMFVNSGCTFKDDPTQADKGKSALVLFHHMISVINMKSGRVTIHLNFTFTLLTL